MKCYFCYDSTIFIHSVQGIILRIEDFRERDERVVLYTREFGKIAVIAKGIKRIEAKLRGNLDIFNFVDILFVEGSNFFILTGVEVKARFGGLIRNKYVYSAALSAAKMIDYIFQENARDEDFFTFLHSVLKKLNEYRDIDQQEASLFSWLITKKFEQHLLAHYGYYLPPPPAHKVKLSLNATRLLAMLNGSKEHKRVRLTKQDFMSIEDMFTRSFRDAFNYRPYSWMPILL